MKVLTIIEGQAMPHGNLEMKGDNAGMAKAAELFPQHTKEYTIRRMKWLSTKIKTESKQLQDDTRWGDVAFNTWSGAPLFQFSCPHSGFLVALIVLVLTYTVWAFVQYAMRPPSEVFSMMPMTSVPPQLVELTTECSEPWACHVNATNVPPPWRWGATPTITVRYGPSSPCSSTTISLPGASNRLVLQTRVPLCYSENGDEGVLIDIPAFSLANGCTYGATGCKPFLRVRLKAVDDTGGAAGMQATIDIEPSQRKAVFVGVVAREDRTQKADGFLMFAAPEPDAAVMSYKQYVADLFYEGKNPETSSRLTLRMRQFAESFVIQRTGTIDSVLGEIGGFEGLLLMLIGVFSALVHVLTRLYRMFCAGSVGGHKNASAPDAAVP